MGASPGGLTFPFLLTGADAAAVDGKVAPNCDSSKASARLFLSLSLICNLLECFVKPARELAAGQAKQNV